MKLACGIVQITQTDSMIPNQINNSPDAAVARPVTCLALVTEAYGGKGGIAQFNRDFLGALAQTDGMARLRVLPRLAEGAIVPRHANLWQGKARFNRVGYALNALLRAGSMRPDIVISGHLYHGPLAQACARLTGAKLISVLHGTEIWAPVSPRRMNALKRSDMVVCVSADTRDRFLAQAGPEMADRSMVLPNTVEDRFSPGNRAQARARFGLDDLPVVLTVGRLDNRNGYKGHDRVLPVLARLRDAGRPARYLIAGEGPDRARLEKLVAEAGLTQLVTFLGYVPDDQLPDLYRAADIFALPSSGEGFGIVYIEAMACGTPAIGLDLGGAREALAVGGKAVPADQFEAALCEMIGAAPPDREVLASLVRGRFGAPVFRQRVRDLVHAVS